MTDKEIMQLNTDYLNGRESEHKMNELFNYVLELQKHEQQPVEMTAEEYRQRMIQAFYNADCVELIFACVFPTEKEFEHLEWYLKNRYKKEPCEDCISRQDTLAEFKRVYFDNDTVIRCAELVLGGMPSVTPQPKSGRWILSGGYWRCSECKEKALLKFDRATGNCREYIPIKSNYCPNCGKKMEVEE